jgi:predicted nucleic acid-binding protein
VTTYLLDVNTLLAFHDPERVPSTPAHRWFETLRTSDTWATCPITENAFVRIASGPNYPGLAGDVSAMTAILQRSCSRGNHRFWTSDITIRDVLRPGAVITYAQVTDVYLLGLAVGKGGKLATFDRRIPASAVVGGPEALEIIPV